MNNFKDFLEAYSLSKIYKIVLEYTLKCSQLISSSDNKKIFLTTRNVRLDSGHYATKYHYCLHTYIYHQDLWGVYGREDLFFGIFITHSTTIYTFCSRIDGSFLYKAFTISKWPFSAAKLKELTPWSVFARMFAPWSNK